MSTSGNPNCGTFWGTTTIDWRLYQNQGGDVTITASNATLVSVKFTYNKSNNGTLKNGTTTVNSGTTVNATGQSITLTVGNTGTATNGQVRITAVEVVYTPAGGSDHTSTTTTITAPQNFNNDLHVGTTAGTLIASVTETNGGAAVSGATVTWSSTNTSVATVDANGAVTLVAVGTTNITATYAGNTTYAPSTGTYQLNVVDNTPSSGTDVTFTAGTDTGSSSMTKSNVTISSTNAAFTYNPYRIYTNAVTTISVPAGYSITKIVINGASSYDMNKFSANVGAYSVNNNNVGTWTGNTSSVEFTNTHTAQLRVTSFVVTIESTGSTPAISVSPSTLNTFTYLSTSTDPSAAQQVTVSGANLTAGITVSVGANSAFEMCTTENGTYSDSDITLPQTNGAVAATSIYVRMKANQTGNPTGTLSLTSAGATEVSIALNGSVVTPMTVAEAIAAIDDATNNEVEGAYVAGIVCQVDSYSSQYHSITYWISDDGGTTMKLQVFGGKGLNSANFSSQNDLMDGDEVVVFGDLKIYNGVYEFNSSNYLVSFNRPEPEPFTLTVSNLSNVELFVFNAADQNNPLLNGEGSTSINNGTSVLLSVTAEAGYIMESLVVEGVDVTSSIVDDAYTFTMPRRAVTVTATAVIAPLYTVTLCDDQTALTEVSYGAGVTLPSRSGNTTYTFAGWSTTNVSGTETTTAPASIIPAGSYQPTMDIVLYPVYTRTEGGSGTTEWHLTAFGDVDEGVYALVTSDNYAFNGTITSGHGQHTSGYFTFDSNGIATSAPEGTLELTFIPVEENGSVVGFKMYDATNERYLYASGATAGNLAWGAIENDDYWHYEVDNNTDCWIYSKAYTNTNNEVVYARLRTFSSTIRTYSYNNGTAIQLAKKVVGSGTTYYTSLLSTYPLTITAYSTGGYRLIASPLEGNVNPKYVTGMITDPVNGSNTYDLYAFDPTEVLEWRNYRSNDGGGFNLESGKGYLYGNSSGTELVFTGTAYPVDEDIEVTLTKAEAEPGDGHDFPDWNLVGNPFAVNAYFADDRDFYTMNPTGTEIIPVGDEAEARHIEAMEGVFVIFDEESVNEDGDDIITFTTTQPTNNGKSVTLNLSNGNNIIDRAIVRFGQGCQLPKFQLNRNSTKLYIPQDGQDYAVVRSEEMGAMPVNFKAEDNGTYTLNFSSVNTEFAYLHLIDNLTGRDIDLLQTPSYTFNAKMTDYESRFKLVFATGDNSMDDNFAFFSNGSFVINNEGTATLQVIDVTGRIVKSESINGCTNVNVNAAPGVYMLRLVNGTDVKVQKVVVK